LQYIVECDGRSKKITDAIAALGNLISLIKLIPAAPILEAAQVSADNA
jgi:hypothetical protein